LEQGRKGSSKENANTECDSITNTECDSITNTECDANANANYYECKF
jgi:hypothetical protein